MQAHADTWCELRIKHARQWHLKRPVSAGRAAAPCSHLNLSLYALAPQHLSAANCMHNVYKMWKLYAFNSQAVWYSKVFANCITTCIPNSLQTICIQFGILSGSVLPRDRLEACRRAASVGSAGSELAYLAACLYACAHRAKRGVSEIFRVQMRAGGAI